MNIRVLFFASLRDIAGVGESHLDVVKGMTVAQLWQQISVDFELLPEKFTLPQFQTLYEAIYQRPLDPRNFRKKVLSLGILKKLNEKDKSSSKKGAFLYQFNRDKYKALMQSEYIFQV